MSATVKSRFAYASIGLAIVHFVLETAYTIIVGQSFLGYLPDCIADTLLLVGAYMLLKNPQRPAFYAALGALPFVCITALGRGALKSIWRVP